MYVVARLSLTELSQTVMDAFYREEIGVGHALLLAKPHPAQQEQALAACFKEDWSTGGQKAKRILLPVRSLQRCHRFLRSENLSPDTIIVDALT